MLIKKLKNIFLSIIIVTSFSATALADDFNFSGTWNMVANTGYQFILNINQVGSTITGTMVSDGWGTNPIEGRAIGNNIYFTRLPYNQQFEGQLFFNRNGKDVIGGIFSYYDQWDYAWHADRQ